jgi:hypothetical protein
MRFSIYLGHFIFFVHIVFSIVFVYEKTLYLDAAGLIFKIVNEEYFSLAAGRYGCLLPQIFTLIAVKLSLPLKTVLMVYSLSYIAYYYLIFNFIVYVLKNSAIGLTVALSLLLCIRFNYFMNHCEMHLAIIHCLLLFAFMEYYYRYKPFSKWIYILFTALILALCFFSHPAILLAVVFVLLYEAVDKKELWDYKLYLFALVCIGLAVGKSLLTEQDSYEGNLIGQIFNSKVILLNLKNVYSVQYLMMRYWSLYFFASLLGGLVIYWYLNKKLYLKLLVFAGSIILFFIVSIIIYHAGDGDMLMERAYSMLVIFVMIPVMHEIFPVRPYSVVLKLFLIVVVFVSFIKIYEVGGYCHQRLEYMSSFVNKQKGKDQRKFLIRKDSMDENRIWGHWALAYETLMYSSLNGSGNGITLYVVGDPATFEHDQNDPQLFLAVPFARDARIGELNPKYFKLPSQKYEVIP